VNGRCRDRKAHWSSRSAAEDRLEIIQDSPPEPGRVYMPVAVIRCGCGRFVLTSKLHKPGGKGKQPRHRATTSRRR
jgi:hypothetical protein